MLSPAPFADYVYFENLQQSVPGSGDRRAQQGSVCPPLLEPLLRVSAGLAKVGGTPDRGVRVKDAPAHLPARPTLAVSWVGVL